MFMEFYQLEALVAVAEFGSFADAAAHLSLTQPAVSIAIRKLEEELGVPLFDRMRREVRLTDAGSAVLERAREMLNVRIEAQRAVDELRQLRAGKVAIGANESTNLYLLPGIILAFRNLYPAIKVEISRSSSVLLPRDIKEHNLDLGIIAFDPEDPDIAWFPILKDELVLILRPDHPLAKGKRIDPKVLGKQTFVAHNVRSPSRDYVIQFFRKHDVTLNIGIELSSIETIKQFVEMNLGIAFVPKLCVHQELREKKLITRPIVGFRQQRVLRVIYLRDKVLSNAASHFLDVIKSGAQTQ
jgi:DNA-binding transcriptional LysR family regulator